MLVPNCCTHACLLLQPKGVDKSIDEKGHFARLEPKEEAATEGEGDRRKLMAHAAFRLLKSNTFAEVSQQ